MKTNLLLAFILCSYALSVYSQSEKDTSTYYLWNVKGAEVGPYGSIKLAAGASTTGVFGVGDNASRFGLKGRTAINKNKTFFVVVKVEIGANLVNRNDYVMFSNDPGAPVGSVEKNLFSRIGYVGISTPYGELVFGKNWGVHYTEAVFLSDNGNHWSGDALGAWNAGTDGGQSGTGRAEDVLQYRVNVKNLYFGAQVQMRGRNDKQNPFADTYGFAARYELKRLKFSASFNQVLDGVDTPDVYQTKINDRIGALGIAYEFDRFYVAAVGTRFINHERDNLGAYYSGTGLEVHTTFYITRNKQWALQANYDLMVPDSEASKNYILSYWAGEVVYHFAKESVIFLSFKIDESKSVDNIRTDANIFVLGINYSFGY
jgi:hypothetical protein